MKKIIIPFFIQIVLLSFSIINVSAEVNLRAIPSGKMATSAENRLQMKPFVHPGMAQSRADLDYMKQQILAGKEPWKSAFERLKKGVSPDFKPQPFTHVSVGPYGQNSIGGRELFASADAAYENAILWYVTNEKHYAQKAIDILNSWSSVMWDLDGNNAKLNVGLTTFSFLNAAEILTNTDSGWNDSDVRNFKRFMLTVYYPAIKDFFTEANGNWDAAMMNAMMCIGVFTDNHEIFNKALERFYRGPGNSGITKYIYPGGQIQESTRDWGHVQLGIGEFSKVTQVAWTQGIDLYCIADDRLAQGYEYCSRYMSGEKVDCYGQISTRDMSPFRDIYESIYDHYLHVKGVELSYTGKIIEKNTRSKSSLGTLTSLRYYTEGKKQAAVPFRVSSFIPFTGAFDEVTSQFPSDTVMVHPGQSVQDAINRAAGKKTWVVLSKGVFALDAPLKIPSETVLSGQGKETILFLKPGVQGSTIINADNILHDVIIRDLLVEGATSTEMPSDPNDARRKRSYMSAPERAGILFSADKDHQMKNIHLIHLTVQNFTKNGVSVRGADQVIVEKCDFSGNGSSVVPGAGYHHNLHLTHIDGVEISGSRFDDSPWGSGIDVSFGANVKISDCEMSRNKLSGVRCTESSQIEIAKSLAEGNDENGITLDALMDGNKKITIRGNVLQYNKNEGVFLDQCEIGIRENNKEEGNGNKNGFK